ncbi:hypothetical protein FQA39_LY16245 [Lamprigera yunnana]|nr:hypothetical protein FQA39_LY16245 [Lamprigera yunnana]
MEERKKRDMCDRERETGKTVQGGGRTDERERGHEKRGKGGRNCKRKRDRGEREREEDMITKLGALGINGIDKPDVIYGEGGKEYRGNTMFVKLKDDVSYADTMQQLRKDVDVREVGVRVTDVRNIRDKEMATEFTEREVGGKVPGDEKTGDLKGARSRQDGGEGGNRKRRKKSKRRRNQ